MPEWLLNLIGGVATFGIIAVAGLLARLWARSERTAMRLEQYDRERDRRERD